MPKVPKNLLKLLGRSRGAAVSKWLKQAQKAPPLEMRRWGVLEKQPFQSTREAVFKPKDRWTREKRVMDLKREELQGVISENRKKQTSDVLSRVEKFLAESEGSSDERVLATRKRILAGLKAAGQPYEDMRIKDAKHKVRDARYEPPPVKKTYGQRRVKGEPSPELADRRSMQTTIREGKWNRPPEEAARRVASIVKFQEDKYGLLLRAARKKRAGIPLTPEESSLYSSSQYRGFESRMRRRGELKTEVRSGAIGDVKKQVGDTVEDAMEELTRQGPAGIAASKELSKHSPEVMGSFADRVTENAKKNSQPGKFDIQDEIQGIQEGADLRSARLYQRLETGRPVTVLPLERNSNVLALDFASKAKRLAIQDPAGAYLLNRAAFALSQAESLPPKMVEQLTEQAETYLKKGTRWDRGSKRMEPETQPYNVDSDTLKPGQSYLGVGEKGRELPNAGLQKTRSERLKKLQAVVDEAERASKKEIKDVPGQIMFPGMRRTNPKTKAGGAGFGPKAGDKANSTGMRKKPDIQVPWGPYPSHKGDGGRLRHSEVDMMGKDVAWTQPGSAQGRVPDVPGQWMLPKGEESIVRTEVEGSTPTRHAMHDEDFFSVLTREAKGEKPGLRDEMDLKAAMAKNRENEKALTGGYERKKLTPVDDEASKLAEIMNQSQRLKNKAASMGNPLPGTWEHGRQLEIMKRAAEEAAKGRSFFQKILDRSKLGGKPHEMSDEDRKRMYELSATLRRYL